jgi:phosphatidylglycerol:prolipoprotein diacylglycerol transferase
VCALFLIGYGLFRFIAEFAREPDSYLGILALGLTMGLAGIALFWWSARRPLTLQARP